MALRKIKNTWYVYFRDLDGKIKTRSLKVHTEEKARELHDGYMEQLRALKGKAVLLRDFPEIPSVIPKTLKPETPGRDHLRGTIRLADMWDCALTKRKLSDTHRRMWQAFLKRMSVKFADQVTPTLAQEYLETYYGSGNGKSYNNIKSILNTVFRCCLVEAGLSASPFQPIVSRLVTEVESHRNLTLEEFDRAMAAAPLNMQIMFMLSRWTAQRLETCYRMTPEMFDFEKLVFVIDPGKNKRFKEWVCCPIMPDLEKFIAPLLPRCRNGIGIVRSFSDWKKPRYTEKTTELFRQLEINDTPAGKASFHSLRGTAITWFKEHGVTGDDLRSITGHDDDRVESIYARPIANISKIAREFQKGERS